MSKYTATKITKKPWFGDKEKTYGFVWEQFKKDYPLKHKVCENCGGKKNLQRHHIRTVKSLVRATTHAPANIKILCYNCHADLHPHMKKR